MNPLGWIYLVLSIVFLLFGYLIGLRGRLDLLANLRQSRIRDRAGLARFMATHLLLMGGGAALLAMATAAGSVPAAWEWYVSAGAATLLILWSLYISFESGRFLEPGKPPASGPPSNGAA